MFLASHALHIELAGDLSTDSFILVLCRFTARRGNPQTITSDNGTNFVVAQQELSDAIQKLNQHKIRDELNHQVEVQSSVKLMDGGLHGGNGKTYEKGIKNNCKGQIIHRRSIIDFCYRS